MSLAGSGLGVQQIANRTWTPIRRPGFDSSRLNASVLYRDREGTLWIGMVDHGLYRIKDDLVDHFDTTDGLSGDRCIGSRSETRHLCAALLNLRFCAALFHRSVEVVARLVEEGLLYRGRPIEM